MFACCDLSSGQYQPRKWGIGMVKTDRHTACKFYSFLMACVGMEYDETVVFDLPLFMQRDLVRMAWWEYARGEL